MAPFTPQVRHVAPRMALAKHAQSIQRHRLSGASRLQQALSLHPRAGKLATRPSPAQNFRPARLRRARSILPMPHVAKGGVGFPSPTKLWIPSRVEVSPGSAARTVAESAARYAPRLRRRLHGLSQSRCSTAAAPISSGTHDETAKDDGATGPIVMSGAPSVPSVRSAERKLGPPPLALRSGVAALPSTPCCTSACTDRLHAAADADAAAQRELATSGGP